MVGIPTLRMHERIMEVPSELDEKGSVNAATIDSTKLQTSPEGVLALRMAVRASRASRRSPAWLDPSFDFSACSDATVSPS